MNPLDMTCKKNFLSRTFSRCVAEMCPGVVRLEYHLHDNGDEVTIIRYDSGATERVDVTGLNLQDSVTAVLDALHREAA